MTTIEQLEYFQQQDHFSGDDFYIQVLKINSLEIN